ncbi:MAG: DUF3240 family protein [Gammaproteobacteria bacterium]|nr:DUF3240 family protein [Gammaproteobacteria bacterium]MBL4890356.1 DUF3240 family protein [Rhizobiaceae bacterium]
MSETQKTQSTQNHSLLVLNTAPELEEDLIDYLLGFEQIEGFTSYQVHGHGEHHNLNVAEQVTGRRRRSQYEIFLPNSAIPMVLEGLSSAVGKDIVYWEQTVRNFGRIS